MKKRILAVILVLSLALSLGVTALAGPSEEYCVTVSMEGASLGQGLYFAPKTYTLSELNELLSLLGYGPYGEQEMTAGLATLAMLIDHGVDYVADGAWSGSARLIAVGGVDTGALAIPAVITENGGPSAEDNTGNEDGYLGEGDYSASSCWLMTVGGQLADCGSSLPDGAVIRWQFSLCGGADLGLGDGAFFAPANKDALFAGYAQAVAAGASASAALPAMQDLTASQAEVDAAYAALDAGSLARFAATQAVAHAERIPAEVVESAHSAPAQRSVEQTPPETGQDVSQILDEAMAALAKMVTAPQFGTDAGEWTVLALARGGYYGTDSRYFADYYDRIEDIVNRTAASVNQNGALHKVKSTENSRLILALAAIGKDAAHVGDWDLIAPYDDFNWIKKQGINGPIFALIALDSRGYETSDPSIPQQCIDFILQKQLSDGGWTLSGSTSDPDITGMALQALAQHVDDSRVAAAVARGVDTLSALQQSDGSYATWEDTTLESIAQVIVACTALGIDPDTDPRFVKNGNSVLDALLRYYNEDTHTFSHTLGDGGNGMATDQGVYALAAYRRFCNGQASLYDMSDVPSGGGTPLPKRLTATLGLPAEISAEKGTAFNAIVNLSGWSNAANYKLVECSLDVPEQLAVTDVTMGSRVSGGEPYWKLSGKQLSIVYFDRNGGALQFSGTADPAEFFVIHFVVESTIDAAATPDISLAISEMTVKFTLENETEDRSRSVSVWDAAGAVKTLPVPVIPSDDPKKTTAGSKTGGQTGRRVNTGSAAGRVKVVPAGTGVSYSAVCLYQGDGVDLIPPEKKAVAIAVTGLAETNTITYQDGINTIPFFYNAALTEKTGVTSYVALVDAGVALQGFADRENFKVGEDAADEVTFGDVNADGVVNAQDALLAVDVWLRKTGAPTDVQILRLNVNGDSRINSDDALCIAGAFVTGTEYTVINQAAMLATVNQPAEE